MHSVIEARTTFESVLEPYTTHPSFLCNAQNIIKHCQGLALAHAV